MPRHIGHPIRCRCGAVRGELLHPERALHAVCYCRDCQTYAHALGDASRTLDAAGGTEVVATQAKYVRFDSGTDALACMRLTEKGILRWYASCCRTPIANTPHDMRLPYVSVPHTALAGGEVDLAESFGPVRLRAYARHAKRPLSKRAAAQWLALLRIAPALVWACASGGWRATPFFDTASGHPVAEPHVLTAAERRRAMSGL